MARFNLIHRLPDETNRLGKILRAHNMRRVHAQEIHLVRNLAANLIGVEPAPASVMARVERWTQLTFLVRLSQRQITGFLALIPLSRAGHHALLSGALTRSRIDREWVAAPGEPFEAGFLWGMGGVTAQDQTSILLALMAIWKQLYPDMPTYSRAATQYGLRLMRRMGYERILSFSDQLELWGRHSFPYKNKAKRPLKKYPIRLIEGELT